jgi:hypothetical protein
MKRCDNCFEVNSDGATNCVICGEPMNVPQLEADEMPVSAAISPPPGEDTDCPGITQAGQLTEALESRPEAAVAEPAVEDDPAAATEPTAFAAVEPEDEQPPAAISEPDEIAADGADVEQEFAAAKADVEEEPGVAPERGEVVAAEPEDEPEPAAAAEPDEIAADERELEQGLAPEPEEVAVAEPDDEQEPAATFEAVQVSAAGPGEVSMEPAATSPVPNDMPLNGQVVLQVFHNSEPRVVHTHPVVNDVTLIGREDPQRDVFPDLDLGKLTDRGVSVTQVSRQHLRLLRRGDRYFLFVYRGSTGTQVNSELVDESCYGKRFEIHVGDRIILGGQVRLKLAAGT